MSPKPYIAGLLPGVELVRLGQCGPDEFEQLGDQIVLGPRGLSQVVVKPEAGYDFRYDILSNSYKVVRTLPAKRTYTVHLEAATQQDAAHIEAIRTLPSVVSFEETTPIAKEEPAAPVPPVETSNA